ncbi:MAG TPA: hypothetical protein VJ979_06170 [Actinomycetota bacterium]|nr:hypothetical protein [Actinomycetota bacterium]
MATASSYRAQLIGSLVAAVLIVAIAVTAVTIAIGPGLDATELRERQELQEERQEQLEERREERDGA